MQELEVVAQVVSQRWIKPHPFPLSTQEEVLLSVVDYLPADEQFRFVRTYRRALVQAVRDVVGRFNDPKGMLRPEAQLYIEAKADLATRLHTAFCSLEREPGVGSECWVLGFRLDDTELRCTYHDSFDGAMAMLGAILDSLLPVWASQVGFLEESICALGQG